MKISKELHFTMSMREKVTVQAIRFAHKPFTVAFSRFFRKYVLFAGSFIYADFLFSRNAGDYCAGIVRTAGRCRKTAFF